MKQREGGRNADRLGAEGKKKRGGRPANNSLEKGQLLRTTGGKRERQEKVPGLRRKGKSQLARIDLVLIEIACKPGPEKDKGEAEAITARLAPLEERGGREEEPVCL